MYMHKWKAPTADKLSNNPSDVVSHPLSDNPLGWSAFSVSEVLSPICIRLQPHLGVSVYFSCSHSDVSRTDTYSWRSAGWTIGFLVFMWRSLICSEIISTPPPSVVMAAIPFPCYRKWGSNSHEAVRKSIFTWPSEQSSDEPITVIVDILPGYVPSSCSALWAHLHFDFKNGPAPYGLSELARRVGGFFRCLSLFTCWTIFVSVSRLTL